MHAIAGAIAVCTVLAARPAAAPFPQTQVTLRVVDELDQPIAASQFVVDPGSIAVLQDGTVDLDPGSYTVYVYPAILGATQGSDLYRAETIVVGASAETFEFPWTTADMRVDIVDQLGAPAAGSLLVHANGEWAGGTVLRLPVTEDPSQPAVQGGYADGYGVRGFPGMLGITQGSVLYRDYPPEELTSAGLDIEYTWPHATFVFHVVDQLALEIDGSQCSFLNAPLGDVLAGTPLYLPVTDDPTLPAIFGSASLGFDLSAYPAIAGTTQGHLVYREHAGIELPPAGVTVALEHPTADLTVNVVDQDDEPIAPSIVNLNLVEATEFIAPQTLTLPVTEVSSGPPVLGAAENGYELRVWPGLNGIGQGHLLYREDPRIELTDAGFVRDVVWEVAKGALRVVDSREREVPGAKAIQSFLGVIPTGTYVELPVNDDALYPTLGGGFAGRYDFTIQLTHLGKTSRLPPRAMDFGPFDFELLTAAVFHPATVAIVGRDHGLRFHPQAVRDLDDDGFCAPYDPDDTDASIHPGAPDLPGDLVDQDGDGVLACDPRARWTSAGAFLAAVAQEAEALRASGRIDVATRDRVLSQAARVAVRL